MMRPDYGLDDFLAGPVKTAIANRIDDIERLARHLCEKDGNDPERLASQFPAEHGRGHLNRCTMFQGSCYSPAWQLYVPVARHALEWMKAKLKD